jgi:hypothetical protein
MLDFPLHRDLLSPMMGLSKISAMNADQDGAVEKRFPINSSRK